MSGGREGSHGSIARGSARGPAPGRSWRPWQLALAVGALALAAHLPALRNGFVFDDHDEIEVNPALRQPFSLRALLVSEYWGAGSGTGWYRPVPLLVQRAVFAFAGTRPWPYHAIVLCTHVFLAGLLAWFLAARFALPRGALLAGGLFAVHTLHTEAVSTAYGLKEVLSALLAFSALVVICDGREETDLRKLVRLLGAGALCGLAVLSKESAAAVVAPLFAAELLRGGPWPRWRDALRKNLRRALFHGAFLAACVFGAVSMRFPAVGGIVTRSALDTVTNPIVALDAASRLAMGMRIALTYGRMLVWPIPYSPTYARGAIPVPSSILAPGALAGGVLLLLLTVSVLRAHRMRPPGGIGAWWAGATYLLASNLVITSTTLMSERFLYLPSLGLALMLAPSADALLGRALAPGAAAARRIATLALAALPIAALGALTFLRTPVYGDDADLMQAAIRWYPDGVLARLAQGDALRASGDLAGSEAALESLLADHPDLPRVEESLAVTCLARGDKQAAERHWEHAGRQPAADVATHVPYADFLWSEGRKDEAIGRLSAGIRTGAGEARVMARARELRGALLMKAGRTTQGLSDLKVATRLDPGNPGAWEDLAHGFGQVGNDAAEAAALRSALTLAPTRGRCLLRLGRLLLRGDQPAEAGEVLARYAALVPGDGDALTDLGTAYVKAGRMESAGEVFERALAVAPEHPIALAALGSIREGEGRTDEAIRLYERCLGSHPSDASLVKDVTARLQRLAGPR